jgi:hypothetical protein
MHKARKVAEIQLSEKGKRRAKERMNYEGRIMNWDAEGLREKP